MATLPSWMSQSHSNLDVVTPIKARAGYALRVVLRSRPRRARADVTLMRRGAERC